MKCNTLSLVYVQEINTSVFWLEKSVQVTKDGNAKLRRMATPQWYLLVINPMFTLQAVVPQLYLFIYTYMQLCY